MRLVAQEIIRVNVFEINSLWTDIIITISVLHCTPFVGGNWTVGFGCKAHGQ